jgi:hypothetical protein
VFPLRGERAGHDLVRGVIPAHGVHRDDWIGERVGGRLEAGWHGLVVRGRRRQRVRGISAARRHLAHVSPGPFLSLSLDLLRLDLLWPRMNGLPSHYPSPPPSYPVNARAYPSALPKSRAQY